MYGIKRELLKHRGNTVVNIVWILNLAWEKSKVPKNCKKAFNMHLN